MRPFYQGKLDVFCAVYAVLNAFKKVHSILTWQAKKMLGEVLLQLPASYPERCEECVMNQTDYRWLVEYLLETYGRDVFPVRWAQPWGCVPAGTPEEVWETMHRWLHTGNNRTAIFRFQRFMPLREEPVVSHWTTADRFMGDTLFLFDASKEEAAVHLIDRLGFAICREGISAGRLLQLEPETVYLLAPEG